MASQPLIAAKLSRPRIFDTAPRERLFALLDERRRHPAIWLEGPAGAGKTSLVASYVEARRLPTWWFQVDAGDADIASFFFYLQQLLPAEHPAGDSLPAFSADYLSDIPGFARRFFRALFAALVAALGRHALLVIDDVHEAIDSPGFRETLREAVAQIPDGVTLVLVSRCEPPAGFARFLAQRRLATIGWSDLQLSAEEVATIAGLDPGGDAGRSAELLDACGGWAAGLTLMLSHPAHARAAGALPGHSIESIESAYDFLAAEILEAAEPATRTFLLTTWPLPRLTPRLAASLSGQADAARILDEMFRQNYFIERLPGTASGYQYHALFRRFLAARARLDLNPDSVAAQELRAARLLEEIGEAGEAFALYRAAGALAECVRMALTHAADLAASGRLQTLGEWLESLPVVPVDTPWLAYWQGVYTTGRAPAAARLAFAAAADAFAERGEIAESIKAIAGVIDTCYAEWSDFSILDTWISRLTGLLRAPPFFPRPADELQAVAAALIALLYRQPTHPELVPLATRTRDLLAGDLPANDRVGAGTYLLNCYNWMGETGPAREVIALVAPKLEAAGVTPLRRAWWFVRLAYHHYIVGEAAATESALATAVAIADEHGLPVIANIAALYAAFHHLSESQFEPAGEAVAAFETRLDPARHLDYAIASYQRAWLALADGNPTAALEMAERAVQLAARAGVPNVHGYFLLLPALLAAERGDAAEALRHWREAYGCTDPARYPLFAFTAQLVLAHLALGAGDAAAGREALRTALTIGARHDYANSLLWLPDRISRLCCRALEWGIETDYVRRLIRRRGLLPPGPEATDWPWPLRIFTLGPFRVERQGETIRFSRKAQKKPFALLMALIALGGRQIGAARLAESLWPDADGDAARAALNTAVYRLRHLLDTDDAILVEDGKLTLNASKVWIDCQAFERACDRLAADELDAAGAEVIFKLYGGHFLDREEEAAWMIAPRNSLKARFVQIVERFGQALEKDGRRNEAAALYERGIALDMLAEPLYRRLMACQIEQGRAAQAMDTYRRCRQSLSVVLGIAPAAETEALHRQIANP
jgi:LuxR family transcriptional regulator, maltose regulon positive regulatory protein